MFELQLRPEARPLALPLLTRFLALTRAGSDELAAVVAEALANNPALDRPDGRPCPDCGRWLPLRRLRCPACAGAGPPVRLGTADAGTSAEARSWREQLTDDATLDCHQPRTLVAAVVDHLDDRGFLPEQVSVVAQRLGVAVAPVEEAVAAIRLVGPPGIAAVDAFDSIRRQCRALVAAGLAPAVLVTVADDHLELVAAGDLAALAGITGRPEPEIALAIEVLRTRVQPFPRLEQAAARPPPPDIILRWRHAPGVRATTPDPSLRFDPDQGPGPATGPATGPDDEVDVEVADATWFGLRTLVAPAGARSWLADHQAEARLLVRNLNGRADLLRRIAVDLLSHQRSLLLHGTGARPVTRAAVAGRIAVHPTTVSRAVRDKWVRCPDGRLLPLSRCFDTAGGPREALAQLLDEHPRASDGELARLLTGRGHPVARRTVAKYRATLRAPARHPKPGSPPATGD